VTKESHTVQPPTSVPAHTVNIDSLRGPLEVSPSPLHSHLQHQSKSFPPRLQRTPSISSQSSLDSAPSRHSVSTLFHKFCIYFDSSLLS
jgi:synaptotagmin-6